MPRRRGAAGVEALRELEAPELLWRLTTFPAPAVGSEISITVPGNAVWRLGTLRFTIQASAAVANRVVRVLLDDGSTEFARVTCNQLVTAANFRILTFFPTCGVFNTDIGNSALVDAPWPDVPLLPGYRIRTTTAALDAGDAYAGIVLYVAEYSTADREYELERELAQLSGGLPTPAPFGGSR